MFEHGKIRHLGETITCGTNLRKIASRKISLDLYFKSLKKTHFFYLDADPREIRARSELRNNSQRSNPEYIRRAAREPTFILLRSLSMVCEMGESSCGGGSPSSALRSRPCSSWKWCFSFSSTSGLRKSAALLIPCLAAARLRSSP